MLGRKAGAGVVMKAWLKMTVFCLSVAGFPEAVGEEESMVFIPSGEFLMGVSNSEKQMALAFGWEEVWSERIAYLINSAAPQKKVHVADFFWIVMR